MNTFYVVIAIVVYFVPYIIAACKPEFKQRPVMFFLNAVTAWMVIPWFGLIVWSLWKTKAA